VRDETTAALIVAEAMHGTAQADVQKLMATLADEVKVVWSVSPKSAVLSNTSARFEI